MCVHSVEELFSNERSQLYSKALIEDSVFSRKPMEDEHGDVEGHYDTAETSDVEWLEEGSQNRQSRVSTITGFKDSGPASLRSNVVGGAQMSSTAFYGSAESVSVAQQRRSDGDDDHSASAIEEMRSVADPPSPGLHTTPLYVSCLYVLQREKATVWSMMVQRRLLTSTTQRRLA